MNLALKNCQRSFLKLLLFYYPFIKRENRLMKNCFTMKIITGKSGFTLMELMVVVGVAAVLAAIAVPSIISWMPNHKLKQAASDLHAGIQFAKIQAIRARADCAVVFNAAGNSYRVCSDDGGDGDWTDGDETVIRSGNLAGYGHGIGYGHGTAGNPIGAAWGANDISYANSRIVFNSRGLTTTLGYVYLDNRTNTCYAVGTPSMAGVVVMRRWVGGGGPGIGWR